MMSEQMRGIVTEIEDEPHIEGRRLTVRRIGALAEKRGLSPETIAERFDLTLAEVHNALAFYYGHADLMEELEAARRSRVETNQEQSLDPKDVVDDSAESHHSHVRQSFHR